MDVNSACYFEILEQGAQAMLKEYLEPHRGVWDEFKKNGFKAYFVGGCVRDALLYRAAKDIDMTTDAKTDEIKEIFKNHYDTGEKFGSLIIDYDGFYYDITTMRTESGYTNFRHPDNLNYTDDICLDLKRRDFTVNAMAFSFDSGHIDLFGGVTDLNKKSIKVVGDAKNRFREDALRMMRAIRFSCELGFTIEEGTLDAISKDARGIKYISKERIYSEFKRSVISPNPEKLIYLKHSALGRNIHHLFKTMYFHNIPYEKDYILRLVHIFKKKETAMGILSYLKADKMTIHNVLHVFDGLNNIHDDSLYSLRKLIALEGAANAKRVLILKNFDLSVYTKIINNGDCTSLDDLAVNGDDIIATGIAQEGIDVRHILNALLDEVLKDPSKNKIEILMSLAGKIKTPL